MARTLRVALVLAITTGVLAITCDAASADGLPIPGVLVKPSGVASLNGHAHFLTKSTAKRTTVRKVDWATDKTIARATIRGEYTVPGVAIDGTPGGLSANGRVLTVIRPRRAFPQAATHLVVLSAHSLKIRRRLDLRGDYSFDAISPTGNRIYLIHYLSRRDPSQYAVVAYDVAAGRMLPKPIVDPTEPDEQMRGYPITRVASPDGRWQYTLYSGSKKPFVHALDTARGSAKCIDLPKSVGSAYADGLRISPDGGLLSVTNRNRGTLASVDTATFAVSKPGSAPAQPAGDSDATFPWLLIGLGTLVALAVVFLWGFPRMRQRPVADRG